MELLLAILILIFKLASDKGAEIQAREQADKWKRERASNEGKGKPN